MRSRRTLTVLVIVLAGITTGSCYVESHPPVAATTPAPAAETSLDTEYYQPLYYDGYVVYFDANGRPYYYVNGVVFWIPSTYAYYGYYIAHWRRWRPHYWRWYRARGYRYHRYRRRPGYYRRPHHARRYRRGGHDRRGPMGPGGTRRGPSGGRR